LNRQLKAVLQRDDIKKNIASMGVRPDYGTPQQFSDSSQRGRRSSPPSSRRKAADGVKLAPPLSLRA
jgi:hypothetical protein